MIWTLSLFLGLIFLLGNLPMKTKKIIIFPFKSKGTLKDGTVQEYEQLGIKIPQKVKSAMSLKSGLGLSYFINKVDFKISKDLTIPPNHALLLFFISDESEKKPEKPKQKPEPKLQAKVEPQVKEKPPAKAEPPKPMISVQPKPGEPEKVEPELEPVEPSAPAIIPSISELQQRSMNLVPVIEEEPKKSETELTDEELEGQEPSEGETAEPLSEEDTIRYLDDVKKQEREERKRVGREQKERELEEYEEAIPEGESEEGAEESELPSEGPETI